MGFDRLTRVNELVKEEITKAIYEIMDPTEFDLSSFTITRAIVSPGLRDAKVFVSIYQHEGEKHKQLNVIRKKSNKIQSLLNSRLSLKYTPRLHFQLDDSLESGDNVLNIISELEKETDFDSIDLPEDFKDNEQ
ncbi:MAG: 30S ribosome-binding factor RbfA [Kiritimatiellae bacterium]|jgi:ribosome-binding factor A|nr:30S ribosome-binding factor RbfA [Kiritimatiellia bacterium]